MPRCALLNLDSCGTSGGNSENPPRFESKLCTIKGELTVRTYSRPATSKKVSHGKRGKMSDREPRNRDPRTHEPEEFDPKAFVEDHVWTFAKTMPHIPHEYVVRGKNGCAEGDWDAFAAHIKAHGYWARWTAPNGRHMDNVYLELGEWKFWVIPPVINRERLENSTTQRLASEADAG